MKTLIAFLSCLIALHSTLAQSVSYSMETTQVFRDKLSQRTFGIEKIGNDDEDVYFLHKPYRAVFGQVSIGSTENFFISKVDQNLRLVNKSVIDLKYGKNMMQFEGVYMVNGKIIVFSSLQNVKLKKHFLFVRKINHETLKPEGDLKPIGELDYSGYSRYNNTIFQFEISDDGSKVLVFHTFVSKDNEILKYGMYVLDNEFNELWKNENVTPSHAEGFFSYHRFKIDNIGNVYLLGKQYKDRENYFDEGAFRKRGFSYTEDFYTDKPNYTYQLYIYTNSGQTDAYTNISLPGKFVRSVNFFPESPEKVICYGVWSAPKTISAKGGFMFSLNISNGQSSDIVTTELSALMIEQGFGDKELNRFKRSMKNKEEWDPFDYLLSDLKIMKNGDRYFIAEQYLEGIKEEFQGKVTMIRSVHMHNDLFVFRMPDDDKPGRIDRITKRQYFLISPRFNSYHAEEKDGDLFFVFNSLPRKDKYSNKTMLGETCLVTLNLEGIQDQTILIKALMLKDPGLMPVTIISPVPGTLFYGLMSFNDKDYSFGRIIIR